MIVAEQVWALEEGETLLWQGRPAPRCYTFRNWKQATLGTLLFLACSFWSFLGFELSESETQLLVIGLITLPLTMTTFFLGPGQLVLARWRWEKLFYALTDRRLLIREGLVSVRRRSYPRGTITGYQLRRFTEELASVRILRGKQPPLVLACLEQPNLLFRHLPRSQASEADAGESV